MFPFFLFSLPEWDSIIKYGSDNRLWRSLISNIDHYVPVRKLIQRVGAHYLQLDYQNVTANLAALRNSSREESDG
jgi:hypothetical protein